MHKPIIGLVGGIGSGKSTVARLLAEQGAAVIESDALNRSQLRSTEVIDTLVSWWGKEICSALPDGDTSGPAEPVTSNDVKTGRLDTGRIADIIFNDPSQRRRLEGLLHPRIAEQREALIAGYQQDPAVRAIVLDSPLLIESGLVDRCNVVIYVEASQAVRRDRITHHRGWSERQQKLREKSQIALDRKRERADHIVVNNSSDIVQLRSTVRDLFNKLIAESVDPR